MGLYTRIDRVKGLLQGKIRFTEDPDDQNKFQYSLLKDLVNEAEAQVEMDLSERYLAPFQTDSGAAFNQLPFRPTQFYLMTMCELMVMIRVLESDFGRAMLSGGDKYAEVQQKRYDGMLSKHLEKRKFNGEETLQWKFPPMPGLRLNYQNTEADDGFMGRVLVTSDGRGDYPSAQINSPSENFWNGQIDHLDNDTGVGGVGF